MLPAVWPGTLAVSWSRSSPVKSCLTSDSRRALRKGKLSPEEIAAEKADRIQRALERRAANIADREVAISFNEGTIRAARLAQKKDRLPVVTRKRSRTMEDENVRAMHQQQADAGSIPLEARFSIFDALRPPWPGEHG